MASTAGNLQMSLKISLNRRDNHLIDSDEKTFI
jgi:hypothetical protein